MKTKKPLLLIVILSALAQGCANDNVQTGVCLADDEGQRMMVNAIEVTANKQRSYIQLIDAQNTLLLPAQTYTLPSFFEVPKNGCFEKPFILSHIVEGYQWFDSTGNKLYDVYWFDNGPDYAEDGLFRFKQNGLIGYANAETYEIVIHAQYQAAHPFQNGRAKVSYKADIEQFDKEHLKWVNTDYFVIDKQGNVIKSELL